MLIVLFFRVSDESRKLGLDRPFLKSDLRDSGMNTFGGPKTKQFTEALLKVRFVLFGSSKRRMHSNAVHPENVAPLLDQNLRRKAGVRVEEY